MTDEISVSYRGKPYPVCRTKGGALIIRNDMDELISLSSKSFRVADREANPHAFRKEGREWKIRQKFKDDARIPTCKEVVATPEGYKPPAGKLAPRSRVGARELVGLGLTKEPLKLCARRLAESRKDAQSWARHAKALAAELQTCRKALQAQSESSTAKEEEIISKAATMGGEQPGEREPVGLAAGGRREGESAAEEVELEPERKEMEEEEAKERIVETEDGPPVRMEDLKEGDKICGGYEIAPPGGLQVDEKHPWIGRGSFGTVFLVRNYINPHQYLEYAMKVIPQPEGEVLPDVITEGTILKSLRHPNLMAATLVRAGCRGLRGNVAMIMPLATRTSEWLTTDPSPQELLSVVMDLICGAQHLWSNLIAHRDIKLDNTLIAILDKDDAKSAGRAQVAKLTDFGLSFRFARPAPWRLVGSIPYMAPELVCSTQVAAMDDLKAADMWALGIVFFQLFFKSYLPFDSMADTILRHMLTEAGKDENQVTTREYLEAQMQAIRFVLGDPPPEIKATQKPGCIAETFAPTTDEFMEVMADRTFEEDEYAEFEAKYGAEGMLAIRTLVLNLLRWNPAERNFNLDAFWEAPAFATPAGSKSKCFTSRQLVDMHVGRVKSPLLGFEEELLPESLGLPIYVVNMANEIWARWMCLRSTDRKEAHANPWLKLACISLAAKLFNQEVQKLEPASSSAKYATLIKLISTWPSLTTEQRQSIVKLESLVLNSIDWTPDTELFHCPARLAKHEALAAVSSPEERLAALKALRQRSLKAIAPRRP